MPAHFVDLLRRFAAETPEAPCLAHEDVLLKAGVTKEAIQDAVRIASIIHAVAVTLEDPLIADAPAAA